MVIPTTRAASIGLTLATLLLSGSGCSVLFLKKAPPPEKRRTYFDCTDRVGLPVTDAVVGALLVNRMIDPTQSSSTEDTVTSVLVVGAAVVSSVYGFIETSRCRDAERDQKVRIDRGDPIEYPKPKPVPRRRVRPPPKPEPAEPEGPDFVHMGASAGGLVRLNGFGESGDVAAVVAAHLALDFDGLQPEVRVDYARTGDLAERGVGLGVLARLSPPSTNSYAFVPYLGLGVRYADFIWGGQRDAGLSIAPRLVIRVFETRAVRFRLDLAYDIHLFQHAGQDVLSPGGSERRRSHGPRLTLGIEF